MIEEIQESNYPRVFEIEEIITISWQFYIKHFWILILISLISILPNIYATLNFDFEKILLQNFDFSNGNIPKLDIAFYKLVLISSIFTYFSIVLKTLFIKDKFYNENSQPNDLLVKTFKLFIPFIICLLIYCFGLILSTIMLIIPGLIFGIYFVFAPLAVLLRDQGIFDSFIYSTSLIKSRFIKSMYYLLVLILLYIAIALLISFFANFLKGTFSLVLVTILSTIVINFIHIAFVVLFINLDDTKISIL